MIKGDDIAQGEMVALLLRVRFGHLGCSRDDHPYVGQAKRITKQDEMVTALELIFERNPTSTPALNQTKIGAWTRSNHIVVYRVHPHDIHGRKSIGEEA